MPRRMPGRAEAAHGRACIDGLWKTCKPLDLDVAPERIEIYDNSHIQGSNAVGGKGGSGLNGFYKEQLSKVQHQSKDAAGDDYVMMRETHAALHPALKEDLTAKPALAGSCHH